MRVIPLGWYALSANVSRVVVTPSANAKLVARLLDNLAEQNAKPKVKA